MAVDIEGFLDRLHIKGVELQKRLGLSSGAISQYKNGNKPSYSMICKLIMEGITIDELFGKELADKLRENEKSRNGTPSTDKNKDFLNSDEFRQGVLKVLSEQQILEYKMDQSVNKLMGEIKK